MARSERATMSESPVNSVACSRVGEVSVARVGELEATVMDRLWAADAPRSVREVMEDLQQDRTIAYTTVMTVLERLFRKGMLTRVEAGRAWVYSPAQSRADYTASVMADTLANATDKAATLVHFAERVTSREAEQLMKALADRSSQRLPRQRPGGGTSKGK